MSDTSNTKLIFRLGEESMPIILSAEEQKTSPFDDTLRRAKKRMINIADQLSHIKDNWINSTPNNIITFFGDRGSGKTSLMRTLVNDYANSDNKEKPSDWFFTEEIDPSFFDESHNVLEIIIGSLYGAFKRQAEFIDRKTLEEQEKLREIQSRFFKVKSAFRYLHEMPDLTDEYEHDALKHLNEGGKIRVLLKELIDKILAYEHKSLMVVSIDDLDLNIERSYSMMEHLRKFLIIPNVIVIVAAKYSQLFDSVCLHLTNAYKGLEYRVTHTDIAEMAERYLNKMFPLDQRFDMPAVDSYLDSELIIEDGKGHIIYQGDSVKIRVPSLIFEKTRFLFYNSSGMPSLVIPRNLRDLRMLVSLLVKMKSYEDNEVGKANKRVFKDYFFQEWLGILRPEYLSFVKSMLEEENLAKINRFVIKNLYDLLLAHVEPYAELMHDIQTAVEQKKINSIVRERETLLDILNPSNSYWNVSVGDVVTVLNAVRRAYDSSEVLDLLFFIESFYSIKLYETYNRLSDLAKEDGLNLPKEKTTSAPELKTNVRGETPEFFRLLGGGLFAPSGDFFISFPANSQTSREFTLINASFIMDEIRHVANAYKRLTANLPEEIKQQKIIFPPALSRRLRFCEFFMLTVKFREDPRTYGFDYRLVNEPLYFKEFGNTVKNLVFDATMPFFNAICPEFAYARFNADIFGYANMDNDSLINRMVRLHNRGKDNDTWEIMSKAAIRNMEILEDLTMWLHRNREKGNLTGRDLQTVLRSFYSQFEFPKTENEDELPAGKYWVKTYSKINVNNLKGEKKPYYYVECSIYSLLADVIAEIDNPEADGSDMPIPEPPLSPDSINEIINEVIGEISKRPLLKELFDSIFTQKLIFVEREIYPYEEIKNTLDSYINPSIVNGFLPEKEDFTVDELARILANMRVYARFDFDSRLPEKIQQAYHNRVKTMFETDTEETEVQMMMIDIDLSELKMQHNQLIDDNKKHRQDIAAFSKEISNLDSEMLNLQKEMAECKKNIDYFSDQIPLANNKTDRNRIDKEIDSNQKQLHKIYVNLDNLPAKKILLENKINKAFSSIQQNQEKIKNLSKEMRQLQKQRDSFARELEQLKNSLDHPRPLELKL